MSQRNSNRPVVVLSALLILVVVAGGIALWRMSSRSTSSAARVADEELERRRVAALDPTFDPAKPGGTIAGIVKDADGRPVAEAIVAATRQRGRDELPAFSRPIPRTVVTGGDGRFTLTDVLPGDYGITATAAVGSPARQTKVAVASGKTTEVSLTLGGGGFLLTGEVNDVGGGAIAGAKALVRSMGMFIRPGDEPAVFQVTADDKGVFRLRLGAGDYDITVKADGYAPARDRSTVSNDITRRYRLNPAARLSGRVLDRQSRDPVPSAAVWLRLDRLESWVDRNATTDAEGRFQFDDLAAGGYVVVARAEQRIGLTQVVSLGVAQAATDVELLVDRGRSIRGTAVDEKGQKLAGVRVAAGRFDPPFERPAFVKSAGDGKFAIDGLLPAKYRVDAWMEGQGPAKTETVQLSSKDVEGIRLVILTSFGLRGQVVDASGQGVPETSVTGVVESSNPDRRFSVDRATTDAAGRFELIRLGPGKLTLTAKHAEKGNATLGPQDAETTAKEPTLVLRLAAAASVSGIVKQEDGTPAARALVFAQWTQPRIMFGPQDQVMTDEQGRYRVGGLEPGKFNVMARGESTFNTIPGSRQEVTLAVGEQKTGVDLVIPNGGKKIAGKVVTAEGQAVGGAVVTLAPERMGESFRMPIREGGPQVPNALSDQDGNFVLDDLQEGTYTLWATDSTHADAEQKGVASGAAGVVLRMQAGASVAGSVRTRQGEPVTDYTVAALPGGQPSAAPNERMRAQMNARTWSPSAQVHDPSGAFQIERLGPGTYELTVTTADGQGASQPLTVTAGERKQGVKLVIDAGSKLVGRVVELQSETPLAGVTVQLMSPTRRLEARTGADGAFTLEGLPPGRARVDFRPPGMMSEETHIAEHTDVEPTPGKPVVDVGTIKLMKGSYREKFGNEMMKRGRIGFTPANMDGRPSVTGVRPGLPAEKAGLKGGELLLKIDGHTTQGLGNGALDFLAAGKVDKPLVITVQPREGGGPRDVTIERASMDYDPSRPGTAKTPGASGGTAATTTPPRGQAAPPR